MKRGLGWKPDVPDLRDYRYKPTSSRRRTFPDRVDLRDRFFKPWNQGTLGSCTAHAVGAACLYLDIYDNDMRIVSPSRLFLYYNARLIEGTTASDEGAEIRNAIKSASKFGYIDEASWPYRLRSFTKKPPQSLYTAATKERVRKYERVAREISDFKAALTASLPVVVGISVYDSMSAAKVTKTGQIPLPRKKDKLEGGHAVLLVGYDDEKRHFIVRNSWGTGWGDKGHGYLPYEYILNPDLSDDFWIIKR